MKLKSLIITSALLLAACGYTQAQSTQVIAHRGFWKTDGSAQNSIAALVKADSINCYGSEFDVWLTADNQLVVNHDSTFKGRNPPHNSVPPSYWTTESNSPPCGNTWKRPDN